MLCARKILFYLFLLIYCILCPILILYSFGFYLNPSNNEISQTGLIHIASVPAGADIFLGKSRYKYKTPATITNLLPGQYQITLKLKGCRLWSHQVSIEEGRASAFDNIVLLPRKFNPKIIVTQFDYQDLIALSETGSFILKTGSRLKDFFIFAWKKDKLRPLLEDYAAYADFPVSGIYKETRGSQIIIFGGPLWIKKFYLFDLEDKEPRIRDITKLFDGKPEQLIWDGAYQNNSFALYRGYINRLDFKEMSLYPKFIENIKGFGISAKWLYILGKDRRISKISTDQVRRRVIIRDGNFAKAFFGKSRFYKIELLGEDVLAFLGDSGDLIITLPPYDIADGGVSGISLHKTSKRLLFWSKNIIGAADFSGNNTEESVFPDEIPVQRIYEQGRNIEQCFWAYGGTHIIFRDGDEVFLLELEPDGKHHLEHILEIKNSTDIVYSEERGSLYYLDPKGRITKLQIFPAEEIGFTSFAKGDKLKENRNEF